MNLNNILNPKPVNFDLNEENKNKKNGIYKKTSFDTLEKQKKGNLIDLKKINLEKAKALNQANNTSIKNNEEKIQKDNIKKNFNSPNASQNNYSMSSFAKLFKEGDRLKNLKYAADEIKIKKNRLSRKQRRLQEAENTLASFLSKEDKFNLFNGDEGLLRFSSNMNNTSKNNNFYNNSNSNLNFQAFNSFNYKDNNNNIQNNKNENINSNAINANNNLSLLNQTSNQFGNNQLNQTLANTVSHLNRIL